MKVLIRKKGSKKVFTKIGGFTLIELMVSSAIFITVASVSMQALFAMQKSYTKVDGLRIVMDSLNNSLEAMTRDTRYGTVFFCGTNIEDTNRSIRKSCPFSGGADNGGNVLIFRPYTATSPIVRKGYYLSNQRLFEYVISDVGATSTLPITGDDIFIDSFRVFVSGANTTAAAVAAGNTENLAGEIDNIQPTITFVIAGRVGDFSNKVNGAYFQLQTTVTPRSLDI
jgi:prepilin-type N-terminal cleavage/methylation domain-containing protein